MFCWDGLAENLLDFPACAAAVGRLTNRQLYQCAACRVLKQATNIKLIFQLDTNFSSKFCICQKQNQKQFIFLKKIHCKKFNKKPESYRSKKI